MFCLSRKRWAFGWWIGEKSLLSSLYLFCPFFIEWVIESNLNLNDWRHFIPQWHHFLAFAHSSSHLRLNLHQGQHFLGQYHHFIFFILLFGFFSLKIFFFFRVQFFLAQVNPPYLNLGPIYFVWIYLLPQSYFSFLNHSFLFSFIGFIHH